MTAGAQVVAAARGWIGTPFHHGQAARGVGCDCAGLVIGLARELQLVPADFEAPAYRRTPDGSMLEVCRRHMTEVARGLMRCGDVLVVAVDADPQHLGILADYRYGGFSIIHALSRADRAGSVIETRLMFTRNLRYVAAFRLPGVV